MPRSVTRRSKDWRTTLAKYNTHTKGGRVAFIQEVGNHYWNLYPGRARWFTKRIKELNKVTCDNGSTDVHGRQLYMRIRVPTELMLFIQRWIPNFGKDYDDIGLLKKAWPDLSKKDRRMRTRLLVSKDLAAAIRNKEPAHGSDAENPNECDDNREGLCGEPPRVSGESGS